MDELIKALDSPEEAERIYAAQDIVEINNPELAVHLFRRLLKEDSQAVRDAIVFALKNLPCSKIYPMLFELFDSPDPYLRNAAIGIFGSEGSGVIDFLTSHMNHADGEVRKLILDTLFETCVPEAISVIRASLDDPSVNVRITAVEYLGRLGDRQSTDQMLRLLQNGTEPMLNIAILELFCVVGDEADILKVLSILAPDNSFTYTDPLYLPQLIKLSSKTGNPDIIRNLVNAISDIQMYAEDIIFAVEQECEQFKGKEDRILEIVKQVMKEIKSESLQALCEKVIRQLSQKPV